MPPPAQARGCKGRSPLHKKTKNLPLPAGKGVGGMGARNKTKGKVGGREKRQAPPTDSGTATSAGDLPGKPPTGTYTAGSARAASGSGAGMQGAEPPAALVRPAPGERTISNAEVPLPRSPLSLAAGTAHREPLPVGFAANHGFCPRGCKGRSPLHEITLILPLPAGKGVGGMGAGKETKAG